jgi:hypothetical protein
MHLTNNNDAIRYARWAEFYSEKAESVVLQVVSLRRQVAEYYYANNLQKSLVVAQKAKHRLKTSKPILSFPLSYFPASFCIFPAFLWYG